MLIKKHCVETFSLNSEVFPSAICNLCRIILTEIEKGKSNRMLPKFPEFHKIVLSKET